MSTLKVENIEDLNGDPFDPITGTLTPGNFLTGSIFDGGSDVTFAVDATDGLVGNKVVSRNANGGFDAEIVNTYQITAKPATSLPSTQFATQILGKFDSTNNNDASLQILTIRETAGSDWTTALTRLQNYTDDNPQGYIQFNGTDLVGGTQIGTHDTFGNKQPAFTAFTNRNNVITSTELYFRNADGSSNQYVVRNGRIDAINASNSLYANCWLMGTEFSFTNPANTQSLAYSSALWQIFGGAGAQFGSGTLMTSTDNTVGRAIDNVSGNYIEWQASGRAIGTSYFVSDERYKENIGITSITKQESANLINSIEHKQFDWNDQNPTALIGQHVDIGYTAQSLQSIDDKFINTMSDGKMMVNTNSLIVHMTHAIQYLMDKIDELEASIP